MKKLAVFFAIAIALTGLSMSARATVTWSFFETACIPLNGTLPCAPYPGPLASLVLSGPSSSGSADWGGSISMPPLVTGDAFSFVPLASNSQVN